MRRRRPPRRPGRPPLARRRRRAHRRPRARRPHPQGQHRRHPPTPATSPALAWLASPGGQAQVDLGNAIDTLALDLEIESHDDSVANHLAFEADARAVRAQARHILATPGLLPHTHRAAYQHMLTKFIHVCDLLQPGSGYGTTPQDYTAWYQALAATNITVW